MAELHRFANGTLILVVLVLVLGRTGFDYDDDDQGEDNLAMSHDDGQDGDDAKCGVPTTEAGRVYVARKGQLTVFHSGPSSASSAKPQLCQSGLAKRVLSGSRRGRSDRALNSRV